MKKPKLNLSRLIGLTIDANAHKFEPVKAGEQKHACERQCIVCRYLKRGA